ncbi:unannotated protein [freshwater metagenome]|uniref:Unannotated protein n=1 Tax=freshwater metagenome TaxID=449393 RepID=A0A6J7H3M1_9ZZZZ
MQLLHTLNRLEVVVVHLPVATDDGFAWGCHLATSSVDTTGLLAGCLAGFWAWVVVVVSLRLRLGEVRQGPASLPAR